MDELFNLVGNLGFPIAVTLYLLIRIEGKLELLTQSINQLSKTLVDDRTWCLHKLFEQACLLLFLNWVKDPIQSRKKGLEAKKALSS